ncbi:lytic transglycosylase domain-containing protein [Novosphingobium huizhouense]|uniref:lytic transglycosylase domain-containing protein n=1 Tax=Novosphingobium huizhouense TaxID=2866625 RepID=UPI001CD8F0F0|nr:lytic transglycosylase domain-containing protein [Novosphingobium huizhouense]
MILQLASVVALAQQCAPSVAPETLLSVVHAESKFDTLAIGVNARGVRPEIPATPAAAARIARSLIAKGYNIDLGLGQINSANLRWLGLSIEDTFDPCRNLAAAARVLSSNFLDAARTQGSSDRAISVALSMYNTGSQARGFGNGYVARVYASSAIIIPAIRGLAPTGAGLVPPPPPRPASETPIQEPRIVQAAAKTPRSWDITARAQTASMMVFGDGTPVSREGPTE